MCNWTQRQDDDIDWVQAASRTNPDTGPMADHQGTQNGREQVIGHNIIMCNINSETEHEFYINGRVGWVTESKATLKPKHIMSCPGPLRDNTILLKFNFVLRFA